MKVWHLPSACPVCQTGLNVTRLECPHCQTKVEGLFGLGRFARLTPDQLQFVETFLRCRGNIKEVERELGISYPTVRSRLDAVVEALGSRQEGTVVPPAEPQRNKSDRRKEILQRLNDGEITTDEAIRLLRSL
jgi:hypothetical protein